MDTTRGRGARAVLAAVTAVALAAALVPALGATDAWAKAPKKPGKPKSVKVAGKTSSTVTVKWGKAKRAKAYQVRVLKGKRTIRAVTVTERSAAVSGLKASTTYKAKVRAQAKRGKKGRWGSWSKTVTFRTKAAPKKASSSTKPTSPKPSEAHKHLFYERFDGSGHRDWVCDCGAETTKAPSQSECAHNASWELVPGTFKASAKATYKYCLQCGESWRDVNGSGAKALKAHLAETGHLSKDNDGVVHDTVVIANTAFASGKEPVERCRSCGATRAHVHSWEHVGDTLDRKAMGGYDSIIIADGYECGYCGWRTSPGAKWMGDMTETNNKLSDEMHQHLYQYYTTAKEHWAHGYTDYEIQGQIYSCFEHEHCTVCGLNKVS